MRLHAVVAAAALVGITSVVVAQSRPATARGTTSRAATARAVTRPTTARAATKPVAMQAVKAPAAPKPDYNTMLRRRLEEEKDHLAAVRALVKDDAELAASPYVTTPLAIAGRFISRVERTQTRDRQPVQWSIRQMDEVKVILDQTAGMIGEVQKGAVARWAVGPVPVPTGGPVRVDRGMLVTETTTASGAARGRGSAAGGAATRPATRPYFFGGYGHFQDVIDDVPGFSALGVTVVQDGRFGPAQGLNPGGTLNDVAYQQWQDLKAAGRAGVKVDVLPSPHYFPEWAKRKWPDMVDGTVYQNIDHPQAREVVRKWLSGIAWLYRDEPALMSYCLDNEPMYSNSGRHAQSRPAFAAFLKQRHGSVEKLNALYGTGYKSFDDVPASDGGPTVEARRAYFDWAQFNSRHFAEWHGWMGRLIKAQDPDALTHVKIMVFFTLDPDKFGTGVDPECFADVTDLAGCDAYTMPDFGVGGIDEPHGKEWAYRWQGEQLGYDLLHSFRGQPVFNSENHPIGNGQGTTPYSAEHFRATFWQGGLHHQAATTTWVWQDSFEPSLGDSVFFRPAGVWGQSRAVLDLNRLADEVAAINRAPARVAILYSPASIYWQAGYREAVRAAYVSLTMLGEKVTFVSERQLSEGRAANVQCIVLPRATHLTEAASSGLAEFAGAGGKLIGIGDDAGAFDEYHRKREVAPAPAATVPMNADERVVAQGLREALAKAGMKLPEVTSAGQPVWGVDYRVVEHEGRTLIPLTNLTTKAITVTIAGKAGRAVDLVSGRAVDVAGVELKPLEPVLLRVD
jgi:hypothetical protein